VNSFSQGEKPAFSPWLIIGGFRRRLYAPEVLKRSSRIERRELWNLIKQVKMLVFHPAERVTSYDIYL
jgi:hypothetical protein